MSNEPTPTGRKVLNTIQNILCVGGIIYLAFIGRILAGLCWDLVKNDAVAIWFTYDRMRLVTTVIGLTISALVATEYFKYAESKLEAVELLFPAALIALPNFFPGFTNQVPFMGKALPVWHNPLLIWLLAGMLVWEFAWNWFLDDVDPDGLADAQGLEKVKLIVWYAVRVFPVTGVPIFIGWKAKCFFCRVVLPWLDRKQKWTPGDRLRKTVTGEWPAVVTSSAD